MSKRESCNLPGPILRTLFHSKIKFSILYLDGGTIGEVRFKTFDTVQSQRKRERRNIALLLVFLYQQYYLYNDSNVLLTNIISWDALVSHCMCMYYSFYCIEYTWYILSCCAANISVTVSLKISMQICKFTSNISSCLIKNKIVQFFKKVNNSKKKYLLFFIVY